MARGLPLPSLGQSVQAATLLSIVANINWKGLRTMFNGLTAAFPLLNLPKNWGRLLLMVVASLLIGAVLIDWRRNAVEAVEARAELAVAIAQRDTLALKVSADEAARLERGRILAELAELNKKELEALQETLNENPDWANQPIPDGVRGRLR
jgi:uncharacterized protein YhaN